MSNRSDDDMLWNDSEEEGMSGESVRKMKALTVKMETASLIGKGRYYMTFFVYEAYKINSKIFFLGRCFIFWRVTP
jgi:hypothetical protein